VSELAVTVLISLYIQTFRLKFLSIISKTVWCMTEKTQLAVKSAVT